MSRATVSIGLGARGLKDKDFFSHSDPYVTVSRPDVSGGGFIAIRTSETIRNTLNPDWSDFLFNVDELNGNDKELNIRIQVFDDDGKKGPDEKDDLLGTGFFSTKQLEAAALLNSALPLYDGRHQKVSGNLLVRSFKEHTNSQGSNSGVYNYPPGASAYPPGAGAYPPGAGAYPPGAVAYPLGPGGYPPGSGAYPQGPGAYNPGPGAYPPQPRVPAGRYQGAGHYTQEEGVSFQSGAEANFDNGAGYSYPPQIGGANFQGGAFSQEVTYPPFVPYSQVGMNTPGGTYPQPPPFQTPPGGFYK